MPTKLKENQFVAVGLLAAGMPSNEVAKKVGVTPETISRWRRDWEFVAALNAVLADAHEDARLALRNQVARAVKTLSDCMNDPSAAIRLRAAIHVLDVIAVRQQAGEAVGLEDGVTLKDLSACALFGLQQRLANP